MPSLMFMLWWQDPLRQKKDLNLEENGLGGMKWKWAAQADRVSNRGCSQPDQSSLQREHSPFGSHEQLLKGEETTDSCWTWANLNLQSKGSCKCSLKEGIKILHHCSVKASQRQLGKRIGMAVFQ